MALVYSFVKEEELALFLEDGIDISKYSSREYVIDDDIRTIKGYLNPRDNIEKFKSHQNVCIKIEVDSKKCYVYETFYDSFNMSEKKKHVPYLEYKLGSFIQPIVLISESVKPESISVFDKRKDIPVLYEDSKSLYIDNIFNNYLEREENAKDKLLFGYFMLLYKKGEVKYKFNRDMNKLIFKDEDGPIYKIDVPEGVKFERKNTQ